MLRRHPSLSSSVNYEDEIIISHSEVINENSEDTKGSGIRWIKKCFRQYLLRRMCVWRKNMTLKFPFDVFDDEKFSKSQ